MSPERLKYGGASPEDDVYAMALTLWEMWTCVVPKPGCRPRARPMRTQIHFQIPMMLSSDELKPIFCGLNEDPLLRPPARRMRFFEPTPPKTGPIVRPREQLHPGSPLGLADRQRFNPDAQALLVTYASNAPGSVGTLLPLRKQTITVGRWADQDLSLGETTVSGKHAILRWKEGAWIVQDLASRNGTFSDAANGRQTDFTLRHGADLQIGECRLMLVSFQPDSPEHQKARRYLETYDGLTGLLAREPLMIALDEDGLLTEWAQLPMQVARFQLSALRGAPTPPVIMEMLELRRVAKRAIGQIESVLVSLVPLVAGRSGPLDFVASIVGLTAGDAHEVLDQVIAQSQPGSAGSLQLTASLVQHVPGRAARALLDQG
jgi:serine/threonine-protein kinase